MPKSSSNRCPNCDTEMESSFQFCPSCGQKNTDGKISFSELWSEFNDAVFNIESRTWRTFKNLLIPGKLTQDYFAGKQRRYVHPLRVLLVSSIVIIIAMSFQDFKSATNHYYNIKDHILTNYERLRFYRILEDIAERTNTVFPDQETKIITDTILHSYRDSMWSLLDNYGDRYGDSLNMNIYASGGGGKRELISKADFLQLDESELAEKYKKGASLIDRIIFRQKAKLIKDESQIFAKLVGHTTWAILLMMPCLAFVIYLLYRRHNYFYIEHLIFSFHLQSFSFVILTVVIAGMNIFPWWIILSLFLVIWIYFFFSMLRVYRQSIVKTLLKFLLLSISYLAILILVIAGTLFISFLLI